MISCKDAAIFFFKVLFNTVYVPGTYEIVRNKAYELA